MSKKIAVIDLGTNTFNLLIAKFSSSDSFEKLFSNRIPVMLGEGTINEGYLSDAAIERGVSALKVFARNLSEQNVKKVKALATSAVRTARNAEFFLQRAKEETGIEIEVISGEQEAHFIYLGNAAAAELGEKNSLIMDIGGGSTEFIIANQQGLIWKESFLLGAARLIHQFQPENPISKETISSIEKHLEKELNNLSEKMVQFPVHELIGSSGAFDSLAEMMEMNWEDAKNNNNGTCVQYDLSRYYKVAESIILSTREERVKMKGLIPMRVEMIVMAALLINFVLKTFKIGNMRSTNWSLKEGVLIQLLRDENN